jgi:hypothetical protein
MQLILSHAKSVIEWIRGQQNLRGAWWSFVDGKRERRLAAFAHSAVKTRRACMEWREAS